LGLGARWVGGLADRSPSPLRLYALLELGVGLYGLALPFVLEAMAPAYLAVARGVSGQAVLQLLVRVIFAFVLLLPPTLLMGATFPVLVRLAEGRRFGRQLGMLYGANSGARCRCPPLASS
jgi:spermidine synthase